MRAFVDESSRTAGAGLYLLAVVIVPSERTVEIRSLLRGLLPPGQRRFHWRADSERQRLMMLNAIESLGLRQAVFVKKPIRGTKPRRCRALCLEGVLWYLQRERIHEVVVESRGQQDREDRRTVVAAQRSQKAEANLRYSFERPLEEPLLWLPDSIAGAASACLADPTCTYAERLARLSVAHVAIR